MRILTFVHIRWARRGSHLPRKGSFAAHVAGGFSFLSNLKARAEAVKKSSFGRGHHRRNLPTEEELRDLF